MQIEGTLKKKTGFREPKEVHRISFEIYGNPKPKKNNMRPAYNKQGRMILIQSQSYLDYENEVMPQLEKIKKQKKIKTIDQPINLKCVYYRGDRRRCDLLNLLNATADILVKAKILEDDNYKIVISVDGSRVFYDKENPRVEIEITLKED